MLSHQKKYEESKIDAHNKRGSGKVFLSSLPEPCGSEFGLFVFSRNLTIPPITRNIKQHSASLHVV